MPKINIINNCSECSHSYNAFLDGEYFCTNKVVIKNDCSKEIMANRESFENSIPKWCPLDDYIKSI